ncbi:hypothetical protein ACKI2N_030280 [Cupriavidus sp. 30B13]|uniref:hypothetical protein n=1 Tax=Cupriavidus sp. 30B13 TaxID=3384241 RepID=UPI003B91AADC
MTPLKRGAATPRHPTKIPDPGRPACVCCGLIARQRGLRRSSRTASGRGRSQSMLLAQYLANCGVTGITSKAIFFKPDIPAEKLSNAVKAYGGRADEDDVLVLVDDTFWGSAKEGILITGDALLYKVAGHGAGRHEIGALRSVASTKSGIALDGKVVAKLTKAGEYELGYLFAVLQDFVAKRAASASAGDTAAASAVLDVAALAGICAAYSTPVCFTAEELQSQGTHLSALERKPARTPSYYVLDDIPARLAEMARFSLGIPARDTLVALSDLTINGGNAAEAFAVTERGLYSRAGSGKDTVFIPWDTLKRRSVAAETTPGRHCGVAFDDGTALTVSNRNSIVKPYGAALIRGLIALAAGAEGTVRAPLQPASDSAPASASAEPEAPATEALADTPLALAVVEEVEALAKAGAGDAGKSAGVKEKLTALVLSAVEQNKGRIVPLLKEKAGEASIAALRRDENVVKVATLLYARLPGIVRLALKEQAFIDFFLENRDKLLEQILAGEPARPAGETVAGAAPVREAVEPARKRLSALKSPAAGEDAAGIGRFSSTYFPELKSELASMAREFDQAARALSPAERRSEAFQEAALHRHMAVLMIGLTDLSLAFPRELAARDPQWEGQNQAIMRSDRAIAEVMVYCLASVSNLLRKEADFSDEDAADFVGELASKIFFGYFVQEASPGEKRMLRNGRPPQQAEQTEAMRRFRESLRRLRANKYNDDTHDLLGNFANNVSFSLEELFDTPAGNLKHYRLLHDSKEHIHAVFDKMDIRIETLLVDFLEQNQ